MVVALALFVIARVYGWVADDNVIKRQVKCKYCRKRISEKVCLFSSVWEGVVGAGCVFGGLCADFWGVKAKRCVNCTSWQDGREG